MPEPPVSLSVVFPLFNERENLAPLLDELRAALKGQRHEIIAVDDASTDGSLDELMRLQRGHPVLRVVRLTRRRGQSAALAAGWNAALGEIVAMLDADGQNDPADIQALLTHLTGSPRRLAAVIGYRKQRNDSLWKRAQSRVANVVRNWITGDVIRDTGCSLKLVRREALMAIARFDGMHRFLPTLLRAQGGVVAEVPVSHRPRRAGRSKYSAANRAVRGLIDAIGVRWLTRRALRDDRRAEIA